MLYKAEQLYMNLIPAVKPPRHTVLIKSVLLLNDIKEDKKYKLNNTVYTFIYFINAKLYKIPFLLIKPKSYKLNTLLKNIQIMKRILYNNLNTY
jgi:hypothetical protein